MTKTKCQQEKGAWRGQGGGSKTDIGLVQETGEKDKFSFARVSGDSDRITNPKVNTLYTVILNPNIMCSTNAYCVSQFPTKSEHGNVYESGKLSCIVNV